MTKDYLFVTVIEESFHVAAIAKYAFVYMAQPVSEGVPAFCLACLGTDNKFCAELVLERWKYVYRMQKKGNHSRFLMEQLVIHKN